MIRIFGTKLCKDCVKCLEELDEAGVTYEYLDFSESILYLKEFLKYRDVDPAFSEIRSIGGIGVPCIQKEDGTLTLQWEEFLK